MRRLDSTEYVGKKYGRLTVTKVVAPDKHRHVRLRCACDCGRSYTGLAGNIRGGKTSSCGCLRRERATLRLRSAWASAELRKSKRDAVRTERLRLVGNKFSRLTVIELVDGNPARYRCVCDCGKTKTVLAYNLKNLHTKSCGCSKIYRHPERRVGLRKLFYRYTSRARRAGREFAISLAQFETLTSSACHYCGSSPSSVMRSKSDHSEYNYNGLDRVNSDADYVIENVVPCCEQCNRMKLDYSKIEFVDQVKKIYDFYVLRNRRVP